MGGRPSLDFGRGSNDSDVLADALRFSLVAPTTKLVCRFEDACARPGRSLERGSDRQLLRGTSKSRGRAMAAKPKSNDLWV
jgi:hypothetical protein